MSKVINPIREFVDPRSAHEGIPWAAFGNLVFLFGFAIAVAMVFINTADFQGSDADSFTVKYQVYLRLMTCALAGLYGLYFLGSAAKSYLVLPSALLAIYGFIALLSVTIAIDKQYALVTSICLWCGLFFIPAAIDQLGKRMFLLAITVGAMMYVIVSWFLYIFVPEVGVAREFVDKEEFIERMGGLGHPNNLGVYATGSFLLLGVLWRLKMCRLRTIFIWSIVWAATIYACLSRTSILLALIGWAGILFDLVWRKENFGWITIGVIGSLIGLMIFVATGEAGEFSESVLESLSKSGESDELTSATGRSEIWAYGYEQFLRQPFTGCGYGNARFVMDEHSYHCHNIVINGLLQNGIFGGLCIVLLLFSLALRFINRPDPFIRAFVPFFLVGGLVESLLYSPAPSLELAIFVALVVWQAPDDVDQDGLLDAAPNS